MRLSFFSSVRSSELFRAICQSHNQAWRLPSTQPDKGGRTMTITALFRDFHQGFPARAIAFFDTVDDAHWRTRPQPAVNSLAWLIWHMARVEDAGVNRLVANRLQIFDEGNWGELMRVPIRHHGT